MCQLERIYTMNVREYEIMYKNEKVTDICIRNNTCVAIKKYTNVFYKQPFLSDRTDILYVYDFFKSRCYEDNRADLKQILIEAGLLHNDVWQWVELTHGVTYDDFWWIKHPEEELTWEQVKIR